MLWGIAITGPSLWLSLPELKGNNPSMLKVTRAVWLVALRNFSVRGRGNERWISQGVARHPPMRKWRHAYEKDELSDLCSYYPANEPQKAENFSKVNGNLKSEIHWFRQASELNSTQSPRATYTVVQDMPLFYIFNHSFLHNRFHIIRPHLGLQLLLGHGNPS